MTHAVPLHLHTVDSTIIASGLLLCQVSSDIGQSLLITPYSGVAGLTFSVLRSIVHQWATITLHLSSEMFDSCSLYLISDFCLIICQGLYLSVFDSKNERARPCPLIRMEVRVKSLNTCWNVLGHTASINKIVQAMIIDRLICCRDPG